MFRDKNLDLGSRPADRGKDVSFSSPAPSRQADVRDIAGPARSANLGAPVQVLARYNARAAMTLVGFGVVATIALIIGINLVYEMIARPSASDDPFWALALPAGAIWVLIPTLRAARSFIVSGGHGLYVSGDRLIFVWPGWTTGFSLTADQIQSLEYKPDIPKYGPGIVLRTTGLLSSRTIPVLNLDVEPRALVERISAFANLRIEQDAEGA